MPLNLVESPSLKAGDSTKWSAMCKLPIQQRKVTSPSLSKERDAGGPGLEDSMPLNLVESPMGDAQQEDNIKYSQFLTTSISRMLLLLTTATVYLPFVVVTCAVV